MSAQETRSYRDGVQGAQGRETELCRRKDGEATVDKSARQPVAGCDSRRLFLSGQRTRNTANVLEDTRKQAVARVKRSSLSSREEESAGGGLSMRVDCVASGVVHEDGDEIEEAWNSKRDEWIRNGVR